jgi:hypothetical protein
MRHNIRADTHIAMLPLVRDFFPMRTPEEWLLCADLDWTQGGGGYLDRTGGMARAVADYEIADEARRRRHTDEPYLGQYESGVDDQTGEGNNKEEELNRRHPRRIPFSREVQKELTRLRGFIEREYPQWWRIPKGDVDSWTPWTRSDDTIIEAIDRDRRRGKPITAVETAAQLWKRVEDVCASELRARLGWSKTHMDQRIRPRLARFWDWPWSRQPGTRSRGVASNFVLWADGQYWPDERDRWIGSVLIPARGGGAMFTLLEMTWLAGLAGLRPDIALTTDTTPRDILREIYESLRKPAQRWGVRAMESYVDGEPRTVGLRRPEENDLPWKKIEEVSPSGGVV